MAKTLLARVRLWTIVCAAITGVTCWLFVTPEFGLGVFLTALWAVVGFWALEKILRSAAVPPGAPRNLFSIGIWVGIKLAIYGVAVWVLFSRPLPVLSHVVGFSILMVALVALGANARALEINKTRQPNGQGDDAQA